MVVKKTKSGKLSITLSFFEREKLFMALINFLENESVNIMRLQLKKESDIMRVLYYSTLDRFLHHTSFDLLISARAEKKLIASISEAIALMWLLRNHDELEMINLKGKLHKILS
jgi:hypothetical protein